MAERQQGSSGLSMTILGCGTMGIAILGGILSSLREIPGPRLPVKTPAPAPAPPPSGSGASTPPEALPSRLPSRFVACVRRAESAKKVRAALAELADAVDVALRVVQNGNVAAAAESEVVILACKPFMAREILTEPGMRAALRGKLLVSICAGVTVEQIREILYGGCDDADADADAEPDPEPTGESGSSSSNGGGGSGGSSSSRCIILRAMPNTAALIRESMTVIATPDQPLPGEIGSLVTWIFRRVGDVVYLPAGTMDACTALCGSGPAFFALMLEAAIDGAVAMGLPRAEAQRMAAQTMRGAAGLVLGGDHPALLRDKVSTPGGCTIGGLLVLEEGRVRGTVARAVREATEVASQLGKGVQGVNGTRFSRQLD